ncbi:hypothetical protein NUW54_g1828 [Trametes sanguinea]|uniref:Uncharacterized protein n=1 Tax=Trametes sanguinea TaxID=158606 RepID=A0ACC1Q6K9_9APHY|nr:hypothetical protein NUW54_g1828 [Trametes sanguinea]
MATPLQPYKGSVRKLVFGIDIGTTFSGISYAILDPGEVPKIHSVNRFPGQEHATGYTKIPSVLYYYPSGDIHSAGAEATLPDIELEAQDLGLILVEWFKLHLHPKRLYSDTDEAVQYGTLPPLPTGKTAVDVCADFLAYLYRCAQDFILEAHSNGNSLWKSAQGRAEFVLSHPNGWSGLQQGLLRDAVVAARLVSDDAAGRERIHFVTEGEASLHFCLKNGITDEVLQIGKTVMIVDAGGGTIDVSSYSFTSVVPLCAEEAVCADCVVQGSTQVDARASEFFEVLLKRSTYGNRGDRKMMLKSFSKETKPTFSNASDTYRIRFGSIMCNDPKVNIRNGVLALSRYVLPMTLIRALLSKEGQGGHGVLLPTVLGCHNKHHRKAAEGGYASSGRMCNRWFSNDVCGFAANPYLFTKLRERLKRLRLQLFRPNAHTSKAAAEGALSFCLENIVSARVMRYTYGTEVVVPYDPDDQVHYSRRWQRIVEPSGGICLPHAFSAILTKGTRMREGEEIAQPYRQEARDPRTLKNVASDIICHRGKLPISPWIDDFPGTWSGSHHALAGLFSA